MVGFGAIIAGIALLLAALLVLKRRWGNDSDEDSTRTVEDTIHPSEQFERVHATLTYPDGSEEPIEYDDQASTNTDGSR